MFDEDIAETPSAGVTRRELFQIGIAGPKRLVGRHEHDQLERGHPAAHELGEHSGGDLGVASGEMV